jgi:DNA-binding transcriptional regulator YbjK
MNRPKGKWAVVCEDYTKSGLASQEHAERLKAQIEQAGHCSNQHKIVEVKP